MEILSQGMVFNMAARINNTVKQPHAKITHLREPAKRIFVIEYIDSIMHYKENEADEKSPVFVVTPTGAIANRILLSGVLVSKESKMSKNGIGGRYYTLRVNDLSGTLLVYVTPYNAEAIRQITEIEEPAFVTIIGKTHIYTPEDSDKPLLSIKAESITVVDENTRNMWILDTARQTLERIQKMRDKTAKNYNVIEEFYGNIDLTKYENAVKNMVGKLYLLVR